MQLTTLLALACLVAVAAAAHYKHNPAVDTISNNAAIYESLYDTPAQDRTTRSKRSLLLLKKKLLLGVLGLKAAKVGAVGVGVGALALKAKPNYHAPSYVQVHRW